MPDNSEYRLFGCEGLVCTNPDFYERNKSRWRCRMIPNGVDCDRFRPGPPQREELGLPRDGLIVLMVSALDPGKRVEIGIQAVSQIPDAHLVVAGDGPLRQVIDAQATAPVARQVHAIIASCGAHAIALQIRGRFSASLQGGILWERIY